MANPNIVNVTAIYGKTALENLTTVTANVITNSTASSVVNKLNNVILSNYTASTVTANVSINRSTATYYLAGNIGVPANSTLVLIAKDTAFYMEEGDVLQANASANSSVSITASYEQIN
jgi:hypothetical protein